MWFLNYLLKKRKQILDFSRSAENLFSHQKFFWAGVFINYMKFVVLETQLFTFVVFFCKVHNGRWRKGGWMFCGTQNFVHSRDRRGRKNLIVLIEFGIAWNLMEHDKESFSWLNDSKVSLASFSFPFRRL